VRCRRTHWFIQSCTVTRATHGTETCTTTLGNSQDRSLQLHGATLGTEVYNYTGRLSGSRSTLGNSQDRSLQLYGATLGIEVYTGNSQDRSLPLHGATLGTDVYTGQLPGPKSTTARGDSRDRNAALALEEETPSVKT
jgi:hypothetical protein